MYIVKNNKAKIHIETIATYEKNIDLFSDQNSVVKQIEHASIKI
jgi:hypothetical protein